MSPQKDGFSNLDKQFGLEEVSLYPSHYHIQVFKVEAGVLLHFERGVDCQV
jgi:hypothetical protein